MSSSTPAIVRMANQIAANLASYPHDTAVQEIAAHIVSFWDPRMRRRLAEHVETGGAGLSALALEAARRVAA